MISDLTLIAELIIQGCCNVNIEQGILLSCSTTLSRLSIPSGIVELSEACLSGQSNLEFINLPNSLEKVDCYVLANCTNLKIIRLPKSLAKFEHNLTYENNAEVVYVSGN